MGNLIAKAAWSASIALPFVIPACQTVNAIEERDDDQLKRCARYYMNMAAVSAVLDGSNLLLNWRSPASLSWVKMGAAFWLFRNNYQASDMVYKRYLMPWMDKLHLEEFYENARTRGASCFPETNNTPINH